MSSNVAIPAVPETVLQTLRWRAAAERMSLEEYLRRMVLEEAAHLTLSETAYLMKSPANAERLIAAIERLESGQGTVRDPIE